MNLAGYLRDRSFDHVRELEGGHQSRVFEATCGGDVVIVKALDMSVDRGELEARLDVVTMLRDLGQPVCRPLELDGARVVEIDTDEDGAFLVTCFEYADGPHPRPGSAPDAHAMGAVLACLHRAAQQLPPISLPDVAALEAAVVDPNLELGSRHILHGDFSTSNLRGAADEMRVFDFDDCGYGPPEFDVANALYMVMFYSVAHGRPGTYEAFRPVFVSAYTATSGLAIPDEILDALIDLRVSALDTWLGDLTSAPTGIRNSPPEWLAVLRSFVDARR